MANESWEGVRKCNLGIDESRSGRRILEGSRHKESIRSKGPCNFWTLGGGGITFPPLMAQCRSKCRPTRNLKKKKRRRNQQHLMISLMYVLFTVIHTNVIVTSYVFNFRDCPVDCIVVHTSSHLSHDRQPKPWLGQCPYLHDMGSVKHYNSFTN